MYLYDGNFCSCGRTEPGAQCFLTSGAKICQAPDLTQIKAARRCDSISQFDSGKLELSVYFRADFIIAPDATPYFLEINTLPGMSPTSLVPQAAAGIEYGQLCVRIIMASLQACEKGVQTWND